MSFLSWLRNLVSGPSQIADGGNPEAAADLHEEYAAPDAGEADLQYMEETGGGGGTRGIRYAASEFAEAALEDLETEEAPPDSDP
jgi:hypothetical protein